MWSAYAGCAEGTVRVQRGDDGGYFSRWGLLLLSAPVQINTCSAVAVREACMLYTESFTYSLLFFLYPNIINYNITHALTYFTSLPIVPH